MSDEDGEEAVGAAGSTKSRKRHRASSAADEEVLASSSSSSSSPPSSEDPSSESSYDESSRRGAAKPAAGDEAQSGEGDEADEDMAPAESSGKGALSHSWSTHLRKLRERSQTSAASDVNDDREDDEPVSASTWQFKRTLRKGRAPELFCRQCGSLLPLADATRSSVPCQMCKHATDIKLVADCVLISHWTANNAIEREQEERMMATIEKDCPNPAGCESRVLSYYNQQLRSADEGQTTF